MSLVELVDREVSAPVSAAASAKEEKAERSRTKAKPAVEGEPKKRRSGGAAAARTSAAKPSRVRRPKV